MSKQEHAKDIRKIFGSVKIYKSATDDWVTIHSPEIGDIKHSVRSDNHAGWVKCDGTAVSRATYADLFAIIGTSFGAGNGTTTFNLPDAKGRVLGGVGTGAGLTARNLGNKVGAETHTLTLQQMPAHTHDVTNAAYISGNNTLTESDSSPGELDLVNTTTVTSSSAGGGEAYDIMQPTLFIGNVFIFASHQI